MKLWLLSRRDGDDRPGDSAAVQFWADYDWDTAYGFVVRAETEAEARLLADAARRAQGSSPGEGEAWLNPDLTTCEELSTEGAAGVVIEFVHYG